MHSRASTVKTIAILAVSQVLSWGTLYYAFAIVAGDIGRDMGYGLSNGILTIVRGTIPQALFGPRNYGAISGAMAGPAMLSKAAGPLAVAAVIEWNSSPTVLFGLLLACSIASLLFYLMAIRSDVPATVPHPSSP